MTGSGTTVWGFGPSVYSRAVRIALAELGTPYRWIETDPFAGDDWNPHPMGRVPVLEQDGFRLFETGAILRFLDRGADGRLSPAGPRALARMDQVMAIVDAYAYWPLVRQVFVHGAFRPAEGLPFEPDEVARGLEQAAPVIAMLDEVAAEGLVLSGERSLADCLLAPMIAAFVRAEAGREILAGAPALAVWWAGVPRWPAFAATEEAPG